MLEPWKRIEPTTVTKVGWRKITTKTFTMPSGETVAFDTLHGDGQEFVGVIGLTPDNKVIVNRQYRPGPEKIMDEIPGGFVDHGESIEASARREFLEETGYTVGTITYLGLFHKDTYMNSVWHAFIAFDCVKVADQKLETEEDIEVRLISIQDLIDNAKNDGMTDHAAVLMAYDLLKEHEKESQK